MLSDIERAEIEDELEHSPTPQSACIDAMKVVQKHRGWVSNETLDDISDLLGMTCAELDNVATFYNLIFREPVGEHVILVCDSVSCWLTGSETVSAALQRKLGIGLGGTTADGKFTLLPTVCLGHCELAPVMMMDGQIHGHLNEEKLDRLLTAG